VLLLALGGALASRTEIFPFAGPPDPWGANTPGLRGTWVQASSVTTPEDIDEVLRRAEAGHFNAIFVSVFPSGQTMFDSALASKYEKIEPEFDPLAYLVPEAHRRHLDVHAWFATGRVKYKGAAPILARHPDWALVGPDGEAAGWLNFTRPDVRQFISDLMLETVERYGVDGLHFDYTRYPGPQWGFDSYSIEAFTQEYQLDLNQLRYADLPAYGRFEGNPLIVRGSAQVLAAFANGLPAVAFNTYGEGEVVLLNWDANLRTVAVGAEIMQRSLWRWRPEGGPVYLLRSQTNVAEYGSDNVEKARAWLQHLGWAPLEVGEEDVPGLTTELALVLPNVYLIPSETAAHLAEFVRRGGGIIFIDGPSRSIHLPAIQAITGMQSRGRHFQEATLMSATGEHPLIPDSQRSWSPEIYQGWDAKWKQFRQRGINLLIQGIYERVKATHPDVEISVTITSDQEEAARLYLQDWPAWLEGGYVDFIVPRGYVEEVRELGAVLTAWKPVMEAHGKITLGLRAYNGEGESEAPKAPVQLLTEMGLVSEAGSNGVMIFDLDHMSDQQLFALAAGPFSSPTMPADR